MHCINVIIIMVIIIIILIIITTITAATTIITTTSTTTTTKTKQLQQRKCAALPHSVALPRVANGEDGHRKPAVYELAEYVVVGSRRLAYSHV
jgi:flagellar basal body-associated protein FliL